MLLSNFTNHQPPRRSWSFIRPISLPRELAAKFPYSQVHCALSHYPSVRLDWLPFQYLTFGKAAILSRLHWWVGGQRRSLFISPPKLHLYPVCTYSVGSCLKLSTNPSTYHGRRPTTLLQTCCFVASPNVARIQSRADGFSMRHADTPPPTQRAINAR